MTKVVVVFAGNEQGGAATHLLTYLGALQDAGLSSEVLFLSVGEGPLWDRVHQMDSSAKLLTGGVRNQVRALRGMIQSLGREVLWHPHGPRLNVMVYLAARGTASRFTSTIHSNPLNDFVGSRVKSLLFTRLNLFSLRHAAGLFLSSQAFADFFPSQPHFFVPNAVARPKDNLSDAMQGEAFRKQHGIPLDAKVVGLAARFDPVKDIPTAIQALSALNCSLQSMGEGEPGMENPVHLILGGDGERREELLRLVSELEMQDTVHFPGFLKDVRPLFEAVDVHVLPSRSEGTPYVLLEAGIYGVVNIGSDIPGIRNLIDNEETGLLFPVGEPDALARALGRVLSDRAFADKLAANFQSRVLPRFSPEAMLDAYLAGYEKLGWSIR